MAISMLRPRIFLLCAVFAGILLLLGYHSPYSSYVSTAGWSSSRPAEDETVGFHLLLPATTANKDVCRLLLSSIVTRYPEPVFIGWGGNGRWNGTRSHLFKVSETLAYLDALPPEQDDDLVLLVDAYDLFFQLGPDVMIKRYHSAVLRQDQRLREEGILGRRQYGWVGEDEDPLTVKTTLMWGPDKYCWPSAARRAPCWAAPMIPAMPLEAWGPERPDNEQTMLPRWLNSGTLIGPVDDMRDMFRAAMEMIEFEYDDDWMFSSSDQLYFADVWSEQEVARLRLLKGIDAVYGPAADSEVPLHIPGRRTEYHVGIDHLSEMFQTNGFYTNFITWMRFNNSHLTPDYPRQNPANLLPSSDPGRLDHLLLGDEILDSPSPYSAGLHGDEGLPTEKGWKDVMLGINTITGQPFPLYHVTNDKSIRDRWWPRMWFHNPSSERLLRAAVRERKHQEDIAMAAEQERKIEQGAALGGLVVAVVDGTKYVARDTRSKLYPAKREGEKGGAWTDTGAYVPWNSMCQKYEEDVFVKAREF